MGLAHRVIPVLLMRDGMLVKGKQFNSSRVVGNVYQAAEIHQARGVDELIILDVGATLQGKEPNYRLIEKLTAKCFMPITVGGGVRTKEHVRKLLASGADKVAIGTAAFREPELIQECAESFGNQAIVVSLDVRCGMSWVRCGTSPWAHSNPVRVAKVREAQGAGELLVTSINRDGMMTGYDCALIRRIAKAVNIPVIANGGCGSYEHMHKALKAGASAVAAGAFFQWEDATPKGACEYLAKKGYEVRL